VKLKIKIVIKGDQLTLKGLTLVEARPLIDQWYGSIALGATPVEQAALAARANADADKLHAADLALTDLGKKS
jgi:hypothetical protein